MASEYRPLNHSTSNGWWGTRNMSWSRCQKIISFVRLSRKQRNDASEAGTRNSSVSSQALYHWATALP